MSKVDQELALLAEKFLSTSEKLLEALYTVSDVNRLMQALRVKYLQSSYKIYNTGILVTPDNIKYVPNRHGIFLSDTYNFNGLESHISKGLRDSLRFDLQQLLTAGFQPKLILIPFVARIHLHVISISFSKSNHIEVIFNDPYGSKNFVSELFEVICGAVGEALLVYPNSKVNFRFKSEDQQGAYDKEKQDIADNYNCGPISIANIESEIQHTINRNYAEATSLGMISTAQSVKVPKYDISSSIHFKLLEQIRLLQYMRIHDAPSMSKPHSNFQEVQDVLECNLKQKIEDYKRDPENIAQLKKIEKLPMILQFELFILLQESENHKLDVNLENPPTESEKLEQAFKLLLIYHRPDKFIPCFVDIFLKDQAREVFDAISNNRFDLLKFLLERNPTLINSTNAAGQTPIMLALHLDRMEAIEILVMKKANISKTDIWGHNCLMYATNSHNTFVKFCKYLDQKSVMALCKQCDFIGNTVLTYAILHGECDIVGLAKEGHHLISPKPLLNASLIEDEQVRLKVSEHLLDIGVADVNEEVTVWSSGHVGTILMQVALNGDHALAKLLIDRGADVAAGILQQKYHGMHYHPDDVFGKMFYDAFFKPGLQGKNVLMFASEGGDLRTLQYVETALRKRGIDINKYVNCKTYDGSTALMFAASKGQIEAASFLDKLGADLNISDRNGNTALIHACLAVQAEMAVILAQKMRYSENFFDQLTDALRIIISRELRDEGKETNPFAVSNAIELLIRLGADPLKTQLIDKKLRLNGETYITGLSVLDNVISKLVNIFTKIGYPNNNHITFLFETLLDNIPDAYDFAIERAIEQATKKGKAHLVEYLEYKRAHKEVVMYDQTQERKLYEIIQLNQSSDRELYVAVQSNINCRELYLRARADKNWDLAVTLVVRKLVDVNLYSLQGTTLLIEVVKDNNTNLVSFVLAQGAKTELSDKEKHFTPMDHACWKLNNQIISILRQGTNGQKELDRSLIRMMQYNDLKAVEIAVNEGANPKACIDGLTSVLVACHKGNVEAVKFLHKQGGLIDYKVLEAVIHNKYNDIVEYIIENGNIEKEDLNKGLLCAARASNLTVCELLISKGADINYQERIYYSYVIEGGERISYTSLGNTPLYSVLDNYNVDIEIVKFLLEKGAELNLIVNGKNSFSILIQNYCDMETKHKAISLMLEYGMKICQDECYLSSYVDWLAKNKLHIEFHRLYKAISDEYKYAELKLKYCKQYESYTLLNYPKITTHPELKRSISELNDDTEILAFMPPLKRFCGENLHNTDFELSDAPIAVELVGEMA